MHRFNPTILDLCPVQSPSEVFLQPISSKAIDYPDGWRGQAAMVKFWAETVTLTLFELSQLRTFESGLRGGTNMPFVDAGCTDAGKILDDFFSE